VYAGILSWKIGDVKFVSIKRFYFIDAMQRLKSPKNKSAVKDYLAFYPVNSIRYINNYIESCEKDSL
jgi:hypothetical protein